eukprot:TRINITY_DN27000_c0_g1_i1.p1 TRINITY_DN27000_c0_g1~~TRINITY_DN27000_c0_g1_i1.p1  ORF type:complete len:140 (-),score=4.41 TRINITY_DN27000_c0_g1_i1:1082-1501(-)
MSTLLTSLLLPVYKPAGIANLGWRLQSQNSLNKESGPPRGPCASASASYHQAEDMWKLPARSCGTGYQDAKTNVDSISKRRQVFEDPKAGVVCFETGTGEIICEGFDEGPHFHPVGPYCPRSMRTNGQRAFMYEPEYSI